MIGKNHIVLLMSIDIESISIFSFLEKLLNIQETDLWNYNWLNMFEQCVVLAGYNCLDVEKSFKTIDLKELI